LRSTSVGSSALGRFLSADPVLALRRALPNAQRWNKYVYTVDNPLRFLDPNGAADVDIHIYAAISARFSPEQLSTEVRGRPILNDVDRFAFVGHTLNVFMNADLAVADFAKSLRTGGALVVYFGHSISESAQSALTRGSVGLTVLVTPS